MQVRRLLPKFHGNKTRKYSNTAFFVGGCWIPLTERSTSSRLPVGLSVPSPVLDGSAVTPNNSLRDV